VRRFATALSLSIIIGATAVLSTAFAAEKLSVSKAGTIGTPSGRIAFIREKNVWVMDATGANQMSVSEVGNADGRLSWSPDGKRIAFTRSGTVNLRGPDMLGGQHKVYDIFHAILDSAKIGNKFFWYRITDDLGSRDAEWQPDGRMILLKDMNANTVNSEIPNYQVATMDAEGGSIEVLRKDWQNMGEYFISPTMNNRGDIAFVHFYSEGTSGMAPRGIAVLPKDKFMARLDSVRTASSKLTGNVGPAWSPDGKWLAFVNNSMTDGGLYIASPDLKEKYLVFAPPVGTTLYTSPPSFSSNSKWLTFATSDGSIWICDITGNGSKRITGPGIDSNPSWSKGTAATPATTSSK